MQDNKFIAIVDDQMTELDSILSSMNTSIKDRPFRAAKLFVDECIIEIEGDTLDNYYKKWWFAEIYHATEQWYRQRFPGEFNNATAKQSTCLIEMHGVPFKLEVPLVLTEPEDPGKTIWVIFPKEVQPNEVVFDWIHASPETTIISKKELREWESKTVHVANLVRAIRNNLNCAELMTEQQKIMCASVYTHLEKAAEDIISGKKEQISVSYWESHMAVEKIIKVFLGQRNIEYGNTHDLKKLHKMAENTVGEIIDCSEIYNLPHWRITNKCRYGEYESFSQKEAIIIYSAVLEIVQIYSSILKYRMMLDNARILIQAPPWTKRRKKD